VSGLDVAAEFALLRRSGRMRWWGEAAQRFRANRAAAWSAVFFVGLVLFCSVWPAVSPYGPNEIHLYDQLQRPSLAHPLGTDFFGRDLLTRMAVGGLNSLLIVGLAVALILVLGVSYGAAAGLAGGTVDSVLMRFLDGLFALPRFPIMISILVVVGFHNSMHTVVLALAVMGWMTTARFVRAEIVELKTSEYVKAARAIGARWHQILVRHLIPNMSGVLIVVVFLEIPALILGEALVSAIGLGVNIPTATWGTIAQDGLTVNLGSGTYGYDYREGLSIPYPYVVLVPSFAVGILAVAANFIADGLQDALDPRRGHRAPRDAKPPQV
jgi:ABC-type dipeptide/oligopeptide/nickel transport system permease subunit